MNSRVALVASAMGLLFAAESGVAQQVLPEIQVIANTPLQGPGIDRDKIPSLVYSVNSEDFQRAYSPNVTDTLFQRIPGISLSDPNGNSVQQEIRYRGFAASPLQGTPQGLAVYMNGIRINESFGDTVNWDLIPTNAIQRADVFTNNPIFGLNALGGAISLQMKNGFTWQGFEQEVQTGSYGRVQGALQYGAEMGNWSTYIAAQAVTDDGWRLQPSSAASPVMSDIATTGRKCICSGLSLRPPSASQPLLRLSFSLVTGDQFTRRRRRRITMWRWSGSAENTH